MRSNIVTRRRFVEVMRSSLVTRWRSAPPVENLHNLCVFVYAIEPRYELTGSPLLSARSGHGQVSLSVSLCDQAPSREDGVCFMRRN